jgi:drug/metabolite transporter (DMT)-like permease
LVKIFTPTVYPVICERKRVHRAAAAPWLTGCVMRSGLHLGREREGQAAIALAAIAWSTAGLAQRQLDATPVTQVAGRAAFAALALFALVVATERTSTLRAFGRMGRWGLAMTVFLAVSSGVFLLSLNYTTVANVLFMQAAAPMIAALLGWVFLRERIDGRTWVSLLLAGAGVVLMAAGSVSAGTAAILLPLLMTASFAAVIVIARHRREVSMMPATCASQVLVVAACLPFVDRASIGDGDWAVLAALGIGQMGVGLALLTVGARLIPPAQVAVISLLEIVLGPLWVWLAYEERPTAATVAGGVVVVAAVVVQAWSPGRTARRREPSREPVPEAHV